MWLWAGAHHGTLEHTYARNGLRMADQEDFQTRSQHLETAGSTRQPTLKDAVCRTLIEYSSDAIALINSGGDVVFASPATESVLGYSPVEFIRVRGARFIHPDDRESVTEQLRVLGDIPGGTLSLECRIKHKQRGWIWVELVATNLRHLPEVDALVVNYRDITRRKQAEAERAQLLADAQRARKMAEVAAEHVRQLQSISDTALTHLKRDDLLQELLRRIGEVLSCDTAVILLLDADKHHLVVQAAAGLNEVAVAEMRVPLGQDIVGQIAAERLPVIVDDLERAQPWERVLQAASIRSLAGVPLIVDDRVIGVLHVGSRQPQAFSSASLDLLERAAARASLGIEHARLYAETQNALRVRHELLAVAAHELKTPIASLLGYSQLLQARSQKAATADERTTRALGVMSEQVRRLNRLVNRLLDLSRIENSTFVILHEPVDLLQVIRDVVETTRLSLEMHTIEEIYPHAPVMVSGDTIRLEQVVHNLLGNAIKYSPWGGTISVQLLREDDTAVLTITDHGIGIPVEDQPNLFQPFYRVKSSEHQFQGLGIGLYIVRETIERHEGTVTIQSSKGEGSTFTVRIPLLLSERA
jgi:PAS domain S-box-containing protein